MQIKARQTASSLNSLYAVGPSDQVLLIERGPDGFWGWWRATGVIYHRWQDRPFSAWRKWTGLGGPPGGARTVSVDTINDGGLDVFTIGGDDAVYHRWQDKPFDVWHPWESLGGAVESLSVAKAPTGGLAVFAIALDERVSCRYQARPSGEWSEWIRRPRSLRRRA